jgi:undecaprenyl-diphosphatase
MTDTFIAIALGVVEGITEFLPVSSTGHLLIAQHFIPRQSDLFNVVIQAGAVLAVIPLFHQRFHQFIFRWRDPAVRDYMLKIIAACAITGGPGYLMEKKGFKLPETLLPVALALFIGGVLFIVVEGWLAKRGREPGTSVTWNVAVAVGIGQLIAAAFPGSSRSGTTILFSLLLGLSRPLATEFSFLVSIPTMLAASGLKIFKAFHHPIAPVHENWTMVIVASIVAAVVSFVVVKWFLHYVQTHTFVAFGWYRIILSVLILSAIFTGFLHDDKKETAPPHIAVLVCPAPTRNAAVPAPGLETRPLSSRLDISRAGRGMMIIPWPCPIYPSDRTWLAG